MKKVCTDEIKEWLRVNLTAEKYVHSLGTAEAAKAIAEKCDYDEDKAYFAVEPKEFLIVSRSV